MHKAKTKQHSSQERIAKRIAFPKLRRFLTLFLQLLYAMLVIAFLINLRSGKLVPAGSAAHFLEERNEWKNFRQCSN